MKKVIKLTESDLERIVRRVIEEQYAGVAFGAEQNGLRIKKVEATEQVVTGQQSTPPANLSPEQTTKIQKIDNILGIAKTAPEIWRSNFVSVFRRVKMANWYSSSTPATNQPQYPDFGYVKKGNNLDNYKKALELLTSDKFLSSEGTPSKPNDPTRQYVLGSYVSGPIAYKVSAINDGDYSANGLQKPEIVGVTKIAENTINAMQKSLEAISVFNNGFNAVEYMNKQLPNTEFDYGKLPKLQEELDKISGVCEQVADLAKSKLQNPQTKMPNADYKQKVDFLLSKIG